VVLNTSGQKILTDRKSLRESYYYTCIRMSSVNRSRSASRSLTPRTRAMCSVPQILQQENNMITDESSESSPFPVRPVAPNRRDNRPLANPLAAPGLGPPMPWPASPRMGSPGSSVSDYSIVINNSQTASVAAEVQLMPHFPNLHNPNLQIMQVAQFSSSSPAASSAEQRAVAAEEYAATVQQQAFLAVQHFSCRLRS